MLKTFFFLMDGDAIVLFSVLFPLNLCVWSITYKMACMDQNAFLLSILVNVISAKPKDLTLKPLWMLKGIFTSCISF